MYHRVITLTLDITNELGHRLFDQNSPLFGVIAIQNVGYGWVARHPTLHALNIFWVFDPYASSTASHIRQYNLIFDLDDTLPGLVLVLIAMYLGRDLKNGLF